MAMASFGGAARSARIPVAHARPRRRQDEAAAVASFGDTDADPGGPRPPAWISPGVDQAPLWVLRRRQWRVALVSKSGSGARTSARRPLFFIKPGTSNAVEEEPGSGAWRPDPVAGS
jgi:hypothetical protein